MSSAMWCRPSPFPDGRYRFLLLPVPPDRLLSRQVLWLLLPLSSPARWSCRSRQAVPPPAFWQGFANYPANEPPPHARPIRRGWRTAWRHVHSLYILSGCPTMHRWNSVAPWHSRVSGNKDHLTWSGRSPCPSRSVYFSPRPTHSSWWHWPYLPGSCRRCPTHNRPGRAGPCSYRFSPSVAASWLPSGNFLR